MAQPNLIPMPFAENATPGTIEPIQATTPTVPQDATWSAGFPQVTMQPLASGGIPPRGQNFNGVLNALSQHIFHMQGGGQYKWDDDHGPYSIGDVLQSDDGLRSYVSVVNNNTDNFNTTPSAIGDTWLPWSGGAASELIAGLLKIATTAQAQALTNDEHALTPKKLADALAVRGIQTFASSGNFIVPPNVTTVEVEVWGGGGGGGSGTGPTTGGSGGAGGGYCLKRVSGLVPGASISVTVGAGGTAGVASDGGAGGTSSFGTYCSATGGEGGKSSVAGTNEGAYGGVGIGGDLNLRGQTSEPNIDLAGSAGGMGARGGSGGFAGVANGGGFGTVPGGGGGGGDNGVSVPGGAGGGGLVIVRWSPFYG